MRIFISYSSRYRDICERLQLALEADGRHQVFVDRSELEPGQPFDEKLRKGIQECDLLLFLISPESVAQGSYALAELNLAKARWRHPGGHVLPVKVAPTPLAAIPAYLRAVTILDPQGDLVAETVAAVAAVRPPATRGRGFALLAVGVVVAVGLAAAGYHHWQQKAAAEAQATAFTVAAQQMCEVGDHALAWQRFDEAVARYPARPPLRLARETCGMRWLREIRVRGGKETFTDIVNRILPVLAEGAASASGQHLADLQAHMGWADYLRARDGAAVDPQLHYQKALATEPANVYAQAMWGHYLLSKRQPLKVASVRFEAALVSGRERAFVRKLQFAALLNDPSIDTLTEAARVASDMRRKSEAIDEETREWLWRNVYSSNLYLGNWRVQRERFLSALGDAESPQTFEWLFPESQVREDRRDLWRFFMASLEQASGASSAARARYESLLADLQRKRSSGTLLDATTAALKQLQAL